MHQYEMAHVEGAKCVDEATEHNILVESIEKMSQEEKKGALMALFTECRSNRSKWVRWRVQRVL